MHLFFYKRNVSVFLRQDILTKKKGISSMDRLSRKAFHSDLHNTKKLGVLTTRREDCTVVETVYQHYYSGHLWVQEDTTKSDGSISTRYKEYSTDREIIAFAERLRQQKQASE